MPLSVDDSLRDPSAYPFPVERVDRIETHISRIYLAGEKVYKVKKSIDLGFLDYTTLERREHFCREELRLNRRMAPEVYLRVAPIVRGPDGRARVAAEDPPKEDVVEWAVEMERLPTNRMMAALLERGEIDNLELDRLARLLADFHRTAATGEGVDEYGSPEAVGRVALASFDELAPFAGPLDAEPPELRVLGSRLHDFLRGRTEDFLERERPLLERRVAEGRIREGHGDLHAENVCYLEGGPVAYDCIEFNREFRCCDVAADLAFLAMDMDHRGFPAFGRMLVRKYVERSGDRELERVMTFYKGCRAIVRAKVAVWTALELEGNAREERRLEALRYLHQAAAYELPSALVLMCGLPGTGKSWVARSLARPFHATVLASDVRRKRLAGLRPGESARSDYGEGLYAPELRDRTYDSLLESEATALLRERSVVVDATFARADLRRRFVDVAARLGRPFFVVQVRASEEQVRERMERREREGGSVSDAGMDVYLRARESFEAPDEVDPARVIVVDSEARPVEEEAARLIDAMVASVG